MAGYDYEPDTFKLRFADPRLDGLTVRMQSVSIGEFLDIVNLADAVRRDGEAEVMEKLLATFSDALIGWNLRLKGQDIPADPGGVRRVPVPLFLTILEGWTQAMAEPERPLPSGSPLGEPSPEGSMPMEPLSASPPS